MRLKGESMRFLIFIHALGAGGAERVTVNLANKWVSLGHEVTIVTLDSGQDSFYDLDAHVSKVCLHVAKNSENLFDAVFSNFNRIRAIRRVLRERRPDVAIGMMTTVGVLLALSRIGVGGFPLIISEHNYPPKLRLSRFWSWLRKCAYPLADGVTMLTTEGVDWLTKEIPSAQGYLMPNPINFPVPRSEPIKDPGSYVQPHRRLLLAVGRLSEQKGFDILLQAFSRIRDRAPDWDLVVLGEGELRGELEKSISLLGLEGRVAFPGTAGNVGDWYARADIFVMSSRFEGFPMTLGEAMASGVACISFDCDTGPRDLIDHMVNGVLVNHVEDQVALADSLLGLMCNASLRSALGQKAKAIGERYSMESVVERWDKLISEVPRS